MKRIFFTLCIIAFMTISVNTRFSALESVNADEERDVGYEVSALAQQMIDYEERLAKNPFDAEVEEAMWRNEWENLVNQHQEGKEVGFNYFEDTNRCQNRQKDGTIADFYYFVPSYRGALKAKGDVIEFSGECFKDSKITLVELTDKEAILEFDVKKSLNFLCREYLLIATSRIHEPKNIFTSTKHHLKLKHLTQDDITEIQVSGLRILGFCQDSFQEIRSLFKTVRLYLGGFSPKHGHVPPEMARANVDFIKRYADLEFVPRSKDVAKTIIDIKSTIHSGDFLGVTRLDGVDELIMMGTGSSFGHSTVACWIEGELYVLESQDGWYWPKHGIQRNKFDDWVQYAFNADFNVVVFPLKEELRKKFNVDKAIEWFTSGIEGLNYGYHNFLMPWVDGTKNMPGFLDEQVLMPLFGIFDKLLPKVFDKILGEALNKRVGTQGLNLNKIISTASKQGKTFEDLMGIVEEQGWIYSDGENYVCSCFVIGFYKAGGLFDGLTIQPQEFGPKDIYQLNFWEENYEKPEACKNADPGTKYCQILGKYRLEFKGVNSIDIYSHMNEHCNSESPKFVRNEGC